MVVDFCCPLLVNNSYTATHPFQYALHHSRPRKWVRNPRSSTGKEMKKWWNDNFVEMWIFPDRNSKPISVETNKLSGHILLTSAFLSSRDQGFLSHRTTGGWVKHVWTCGGSPKIPWFITMFPKFLHVHLGNIPHVQPPKIILSWLYTVIICYIYPIIHKHISSCPFYPHLKLVNTGFPVDCSF